jgi:hypothetical protein
MLPRGGGGTANLAFLPLTVAYLSVVAALGWLGRRRLD